MWTFTIIIEGIINAEMYLVEQSLQKHNNSAENCSLYCKSVRYFKSDDQENAMTKCLLF